MLYQSDIEIIEKYFSEKLSDMDLVSFNQRLASDKEFAEEFYMMKDIYGGIRSAGRLDLKKQLSAIKTIQPNEKSANFKWLKIIGIAASVLIMVGFAYFLNDRYAFFTFKTNALTINRLTYPVYNIDVYKEKVEVNPNKTSLIQLKTGEFLNIPKNIFVNLQGNIIKENIPITYSNYNSMFDQFIGGIPTAYDSAGHIFHLQDAHLFKLSFPTSSQVCLAKESTIVLMLPISFNTNEYEVYKLDTLEKKWALYHNFKTFDLSHLKNKKLVCSIVKPRLEDKSKPRFRIIASPKQFPELAEYKNYIFEAVTSQQNFNMTDTQSLWKNAVIKKSKPGDIYQVTLINDSRSVTYQVIPVFPSQYFTAAMLAYNNKIAKIISTQSTTFSDKEIEFIQKLLTYPNNNNYLYSLIAISDPGIYAYGKLKHLDNKPERNVSFIDSNKHALVIKQLAVADFSQQVLYRYKPQRSINLTMENTVGECIFATTEDNSFAYLTPEEFKNITFLPQGTKIKLNIVKINTENYARIKDLFKNKNEVLGEL